MNEYQLDCAATWPELYNKAPRKKRAYRIIKTLEDFFGKEKIRTLTLLDVGSSTGIMDDQLATKFKNVVGIDIEEDAVRYSQNNFKRKNLQFKLGDAMNLDFKDNSFDVIICTHIYEHVPNAEKLFSEIFRVLKPSGVCYLAAINSLWPIEPHYKLLFLSLLPKYLANIYVRLFNKADSYYETPRSYWELRKMVSKFNVIDYTPKVLSNPRKLGYGDILPSQGYKHQLLKHLSSIFKYFVPTFFWLLVKPEKRV